MRSLHRYEGEGNLTGREIRAQSQCRSLEEAMAGAGESSWTAPSWYAPALAP